ncbi:hypothetical protein V6R21_24805 [Limibacter armeniacum]|uniref:hypothetical protein n=1 Tax=Limibacter armeniacum TaxID=466084 RepID=UPI002FE57960
MIIELLALSGLGFVLTQNKAPKVLVACEESQTVTKAFRDIGFTAFSCDIKETSGQYPEWHIQGDALEEAYSGKYDMMIAHPPCTYLAVSGNAWLYNKNGTKNKDRWHKRKKALEFVKDLMEAPIDHIAIENPVSVISSQIRRPDQIIQPYQFGDSFQKKTCLWLKNLPALEFTNVVSSGDFVTWVDKNGKKKKQPKWYYEASFKPKEERQRIRSKTFQGIANAMADQWSKCLIKDN